MDFWSRLIGGSRSLSAKVSRPASPTERLTTFKRTCNTLQQIWRSSTAPTSDQSATTHARTCIDRLNAVLSDESRGPAPHPCLAYAASSQIFVTVTKLALSSSDDAILRSATTFFNTLIDSEVDGVVDNRLFARALVDLVRRADKHSEDVEGRLVELLFGIANNIRLQPPILPAWFAPRSDEPERDAPTANSGAEFAGAMRKDDFPLFYLLVEYVHHAGRAGDFARTGLLYLIETASRSKDLERWLIESDLATLMATGLGALYSQLGSLSFEMAVEENVPHIIALSDHAKQETALSPSLGLTMDSFMSYLLFWQDTIDHCKSAEVNATLLDHFQVLFLEQLLYPSLLESSDVQGGSTAAVLTYLCRILNSIEQRDLVHRILHFLLASPSAIEAKPRTNVDMSLSRRKSLDVLAAFSEEAARPSPSLFNLRDLTLLGMQSANRQTVLATLRLMAVVLQRHHTFARYLIRTVPDQPAQQRTVGALNAELQNLVGMATSIVDDPTLDESFDNYLRDATWVVESRLYIPPAEDDADCPLEMRRDDPIVQELLHCLEDFFANSVIVNLALTEVLMSIASSHLISLDGWLLVDPSKYKYPSPDNASTGDSEAMHILEQIQFAHHEPTWSSADAPTVTSVLQKLVGRIQQWRTEVPDFDILVAARRDLLHHEEDPTQQQPRGERTPGTPTRGSSERPPRKAPREFDIGSPRGRKSRPLDLQSLTSSPQRSAVGSPLREPSILSSQSRDSSAARAAAAAEELRARLAKPFEVVTPHRTPVEESPDDVGDGVNGEERDSAIVDEEPQSATLGHVLTNVVILYEFLLEIAAMVQARATIFGEAGYPMVDGEVS